MIRFKNSIPSRKIGIAGKDILIILLSSIGIYMLSLKLNISESIYLFCHRYENFQLDEFLIVFLLLSFSLSIFSFRRWKELKLEIALRENIHSRLLTSLEDKEILLREIHHRVKNNFQIMSSLLALQKEKISDGGLKQIFSESENRIRTMALIHDRLYNSGNTSRVDFSGFLRQMADEMTMFYPCKSPVTLDIQTDEIILEIDMAVPCGLIANEVLTNSLKHAFPGDRGDNRISITLKKIDGDILLIIADNGAGLPDDLDIDRASSLGMKLISGLCRQIKGSYSIQNDNGTVFRIRFPITNYRQPR